MLKHNTLFLGLSLISLILCGCSFAAPLPCEGRLAEAALPQNVFYLPENEAPQLQRVLDRLNSVRLKPGGNYRKSFSIKLKSNQSIYGLAGTQLPEVIIPEGTTNALLSDVNATKISFTGFTKPTTGNCLSRIRGVGTKLQVDNALLENNLFIDLGIIQVDTSKKGYLKNNRFIRTTVHGNSPAISITGDSAKQSSNNLFVWANMLSPEGDSIIIKNQKSITFMGIDAEAWNLKHLATYPGMMNVLNTDSVSVLMSNGGDFRQTGQYFNLDVKNVILQSMRIGGSKNPGIILGDHVDKLVTIDGRDIGLAKSNPATQIIDLFYNAKPTIAENGVIFEPENITSKTHNAIIDALNSDKAIYESWQTPVFAAIPDPAGSNWQANLNQKPDSSDTIQSLIDSKGIAELKAGIYYISKPLVLKLNQGIIGAGASKTVIIAKSPTIDIIQGAEHLDATSQANNIARFTLTDITLQGGLNGIHHSNTGSGQRAVYEQMTLSHVTFRNMANAGIFIDNIYAWDNNFIDHVNFFRCKTGIMQRPDPAYVSGSAPGMTYLDKNVFYQLQFIENEIAIDWQAKRGNNLNAFIDSLFKNNTQTLNFVNSDSNFFANSVFESTSNQPLLNTNRLIGFFHSRFTSSSPSVALLGSLAFCNYCSFNNNTTNSSPITSANSQYSLFINSTMLKPSQQSLNTGIIANSNFSGNASKPMVNTLFNKQVAKPF
ncbi:MAG: hypothetical protein WC782_04020 [Methylococcaceae bacterium]|jgi:hypothetical protein